MRATGRLSRRLAEGIPAAFVGALAAAVLVAILYTVATREPKEPRAYAEFTMFPDACALEPARRMNAVSCIRVSPGTYRLRFAKPLDGTTPIGSRGSCCPGRLGVSVESAFTVIVAIERRVRRPVRASVLLP